MPIPCCVDPDPPDPVPTCKTCQGASPIYPIDPAFAAGFHVMVLTLPSSAAAGALAGTYLLVATGNTDTWETIDSSTGGTAKLIGQANGGETYTRAIQSLTISGLGVTYTIDQVSVGLSYRICSTEDTTPTCSPPAIRTWIAPVVRNLTEWTQTAFAGVVGYGDKNPLAGCCECHQGAEDIPFIGGVYQVGTHVFPGDGSVGQGSGPNMLFLNTSNGEDQCGACQYQPAIQTCNQTSCDVQHHATLTSAELGGAAVDPTRTVATVSNSSVVSPGSTHSNMEIGNMTAGGTGIFAGTWEPVTTTFGVLTDFCTATNATGQLLT